MNKNSQEELNLKLTKFNQDTLSYLNQIKELILNNKKNVDFNLISYFTFSTNISHSSKQEILIIGTYHIHNLGSKPLTNPYICIKFSPDSPFSFSGKYVQKKSMLSMKTPDAWERLNDQKDKEEYWLKPITVKQIEPTEKLSFPNFQLKCQANESYSSSVLGFTYCDENKKGTPSLNQINFSETFSNGGE